MVAVAATAVLAAAACGSGDTGAAPARGPGEPPTVRPGTVAPPPERPAVPGTVISADVIAAPAGGRAWRITYHSTDASGEDVAVSGLYLAPAGPAPAGGFPLITWAHPTTGAADGCEPSSTGTASLPFAEDLLARGWAIVATDYQGLGSAGPHPYLVGDSEAHGVLDAARAAEQLPDSGVAPDARVVIWGFSQGGHAAAFAAQLAPAYAPDLRVVGAAVAAPVSDVAGFTRRAEGMDDQLGVVLTVVGGYDAAYPELDPTEVLTPAGVTALAEVEHFCIGELNEAMTRPPADLLRTAPSGDPAYADRFAQNRAGDARVDVPVLVVQGADDDIVDPAATADLVSRWCAAGVAVTSVVKPGVDHGVMAPDPFLGWIADRFAGAAPAPTC